MRPQPSYKPGERVGGRYLIHDALVGGMGEVYLCLDEQTNLPIALKTFQRRFDAIHLKDAFFEEVGHWVALEKHPNIVRCFFMQTIDDRPFMSLEWVAGDERRGTSLREWLRHGALFPQTAFDFVIDLCRGLVHAQMKSPGIVHRDLKPENVLVDQTLLAKITDFGLAVVTHQMEIASTNSDEIDDLMHSPHGAGGIVGTPLYMPPEQWLGDVVDARADIYALGCVLYELLTGSCPYQAETLSVLRELHLNAQLPRTDLPGEEVIRRCLAKERTKRYTDVMALMKALEAVYRTEFRNEPRAEPSIDEFNAADYNNRGLTRRALGRREEALTDYNQAIALNPSLGCVRKVG